MAALTKKSKLPDVQTPRPKRTIPILQALGSQTNHHRDHQIAGQKSQHHQPRTYPRSFGPPFTRCDQKIILPHNYKDICKVNLTQDQAKACESI
jgi:hypothetical protein